MVQRYIIFNDLILGFYTSKFSVFKKTKTLQLKNIKVVAGLYKPTKLFTEHNLILSSLTNQKNLTQYQSHGKRQRQTVAIITNLSKIYIWYFFDKFIHELLASLGEFKTPKLKKTLLQSKNYTIRIRQKIYSFEDFNDLMDDSFFDTHKGIFLPLTLHFNLNKINSHLQNEMYFRMLRLPFSFYRKRQRSAFDDIISI